VDDALTFADVDAFDRWLTAHAGERREVWLRIAKKGAVTSGAAATITADQAGDVAICHGWIDGHRRGLDATHFLQRYSPRRPGSPWSQVNVARAEALDAAGRMRPGGRAEVEAARADGRWAGAYAPQRTAAVPDDLAAALADADGARAAFDALGRGDRYALLLPVLKARTPAARAAAVRRAVASLTGG
jgi:uncharacterized protein YdeI (YjbR/CyaY-like superfamily)